ncbi:MAG: hypothetical protein LBV71_07810 [Prevotella sp.]|nr:hypothetical protein [Prevotella sp.]
MNSKRYPARFNGNILLTTRLLYDLIDGADDIYFYSVYENEILAGFFIYWDLKDSFYSNLC